MDDTYSPLNVYIYIWTFLLSWQALMSVVMNPEGMIINNMAHDFFLTFVTIGEIFTHLIDWDGAAMWRAYKSLLLNTRNHCYIGPMLGFHAAVFFNDTLTDYGLQSSSTGYHILAYGWHFVPFWSWFIVFVDMYQRRIAPEPYYVVFIGMLPVYSRMLQRPANFDWKSRCLRVAYVYCAVLAIFSTSMYCYLWQCVSKHQQVIGADSAAVNIPAANATPVA